MTLRLPLLTLFLAAAMAPLRAPAQGGASPTDEKFIKVMGEIQQLNGDRRYTESLAKLEEAEALKPGSPIVASARGSVYTGLRDFPKAREWFTKVAVASPGTIGPRFNLAELDFVQADYPAAIASFSRLLADFPRIPSSIREVAQFKLLVSHLKLGKTVEAETVLKNSAYKEGSAPHFYSQAALAFQRGDKAGAEALLDKASQVVNPGDKALYLDTLMEARWVPSEYVPAQPGK